ncbi:MAG TPA: universal stress protein [Polyangiales bacterium]|nr:universal stress protein [Polyangiales bacterium]
MMSLTAASQTTRFEANAPPRFRKLLIALDLTAISDRVLRRTALLALSDKAHVTVLHVVPEGLARGVREKALRQAHNLLSEEVAVLRESLPKSVTVEVAVAVGNSVQVIVQTARKLDAELIVMGRGAGHRLREAFVGSSAERVVRAVLRPVLVVRTPAHAHYKKPALALAFDDAAPQTLGFMHRVLATPPARVAVIHAVETTYHGIAYSSLSREDAEDLDGEHELRVGPKIARLFARQSERSYSPAALRWKPHVRSGSARFVIEKAVQRVNADLLVLGTAARTGVAHILLGTVAGDVLRAVSCDVLLVPREPKPALPKPQQSAHAGS